MERGEHLEHLRNCFFTAQIHFFEHKFSINNGIGRTALPLAGGCATQKNMGLSTVVRAFCDVFCFEKSCATVNEFMHARPLLHAADRDRNARACRATFIRSTGAGTVG